MDVVVHASLCLFPIALVAIIYGDARRANSRDLENRLFRLLSAVVLAMFAAEALTWVPDGRSFPGAGPLVWASMILYLLLVGATSSVWLLYIVVKVRGIEDARALDAIVRVGAVACALYVVFLLAGAWTRQLFDVDAANAYHRGPLFAVPYALMGAVMVAGTVMALRRWAAEVRCEQRSDFANLALFSALPLAGMVVQQATPGSWLAWPLVSVSLLLAYVNIQNVQVTVDSLTGLANRAHLDERLAARWERDDSRPWCLIMVDVDDFKGVNDRYGHAFGDEVLCMVADDLRETFAEGGPCIARYGGDEFAVVASCDGERDLRAKLERLQAAMDRTASSLRPRAFSFSADGALCDHASQGGVEDLIAQADRAMYARKGSRAEGARR